MEQARRINIARVEVYSPIVHLRRVKGSGCYRYVVGPYQMSPTHTLPPQPNKLNEPWTNSRTGSSYYITDARHIETSPSTSLQLIQSMGLFNYRIVCSPKPSPHVRLPGEYVTTIFSLIFLPPLTLFQEQDLHQNPVRGMLLDFFKCYYC